MQPFRTENDHVQIQNGSHPQNTHTVEKLGEQNEFMVRLTNNTIRGYQLTRTFE